jgi:hypothetical protein
LPFLDAKKGILVEDVNMKFLITAMEPIQFHSCFISYSHKDESFARRFNKYEDAPFTAYALVT